MFRIFFLYNRKLLAELSRCAWKAIRQYFEVCSPEGTLPAGILSIATAGDFLNWNPHIHALVASGTFHADGTFLPAALFAENLLRELFEADVYKLLVSKELIGPDLIAKMRPPWRTTFLKREPRLSVTAAPTQMLIVEREPNRLLRLSPRCRILHRQSNRKRNGSKCTVSRGLL